jgi:putative DNA primase/helicase
VIAAEMASVRAAARAARAAGLCVVPPREDGTKTPCTDTWKCYQTAPPTAEQFDTWYAEERDGLAALMGRISGNAETLEFDDRATYERYVELARAGGLGEVVARIRGGYEEATPGDGIHWPYRCAEIAGNTTLARRPTPTPDDPHKRKALIQTRGEGGYLVLAPSRGRVHPSGKPYRLLSGGFSTIAAITPEERAALWALARTLDEIPRERHEDRPPGPRQPVAGDRPGDDFNARARWGDVLTAHGWVRVFARNGVGYWRRPGKDRGISATTDHGGYGYFYPFTSSTVFDPERGYSKFACYAILEHGGDFAAATRALAARGYGATDRQANRPHMDLQLSGVRYV